MSSDRDSADPRDSLPVEIGPDGLLAEKYRILRKLGEGGMGSVYCWGRNEIGQLGLGFASGTPTLSPTQVPGISTAVKVSTGGETSCAVLGDGTGLCWGRDEQGQLGNDSAHSSSSSPVAVATLTDIADVSVGRWMTCARTDAGLAFCWGDNDVGNSGTGESTIQYPMPAQVANLTDVVDISSGYNHSCAVVADGHVYCWGGNEAGELGDNSTEHRFTPVPVSGITDAVRVSAGPTNGHSCAVLDDGSMQCWGGNEEGQLGDQSTTPSLVPVPVLGLGDALVPAAGANHSCAVTSTQAFCWGDNAFYQLGDGTGDDSLTPVLVLF